MVDGRNPPVSVEPGRGQETATFPQPAQVPPRGRAGPFLAAAGQNDTHERQKEEAASP
jgi:hypothetical protein